MYNQVYYNVTIFYVPICRSCLHISGVNNFDILKNGYEFICLVEDKTQNYSTVAITNV